MRRSFALLTLAFALLMAPAAGSRAQENAQSRPPSHTLRVAVPPDGLLAPPICRMASQRVLAAQGVNIEVVSWKNQDQLRALIVSGKADIVGLHLPTAALFESKGVAVKYLGTSVGDVLHVLARDPRADTLASLRGKPLAVPMRGEFPDVLLRTILEKDGLNGQIPLRYVSTSLDAANQLQTGKIDAALIAEPHASILLHKAESASSSAGAAPPKLYRSVSLQDAWDKAHGASSPMPTAGMAAFGKCASNSRLLDLFWQAYVKETQWCIEHPQQAVALAGREGGGASAAARDEASLQQTAAAFSRCARMPVASASERERIQAYLEALGKTAPEPFGGLRPADAFYFQPSSEEPR